MESLEDDPDYQEFLEFKKMKVSKRKQQPQPQKTPSNHLR